MGKAKNLRLWPLGKLPPLDNAMETFRDAGLHFPLVPESMLPSFQTFRQWRWGTRQTSRSAYQWEWFVAEAESDTDRPADYVLIEHAGHGINSYSIHYYVVTRNLAMFLQIFYGGAYMPEPETKERVNRMFDAASEVLRLAEAIDPSLDLPGRLIVAASDRVDGGYARWTNDPPVDTRSKLTSVENAIAEARERLASVGGVASQIDFNAEVPALKVQVTAEQAWEDFERDLAAALEMLAEDEYLAVERKRTNLYVQFSAQGAFGMRAEAVSNTFLSGADTLSAVACEHLIEIGWNAPTYVPEDGVPEPADGSCNFYIDAANPVPWAYVAGLAVRTLREVHSARHPGDLQYSAKDADGDAVAVGNLKIRKNAPNDAGA